MRNAQRWRWMMDVGESFAICLVVISNYIQNKLHRISPVT
jgi:hypothetical protein